MIRCDNIKLFYNVSIKSFFLLFFNYNELEKQLYIDLKMKFVFA